MRQFLDSTEINIESQSHKGRSCIRFANKILDSFAVVKYLRMLDMLNIIAS